MKFPVFVSYSQSTKFAGSEGIRNAVVVMKEAITNEHGVLTEKGLKELKKKLLEFAKKQPYSGGVEVFVVNIIPMEVRVKNITETPSEED